MHSRRSNGTRTIVKYRLMTVERSTALQSHTIDYAWKSCIRHLATRELMSAEWKINIMKYHRNATSTSTRKWKNLYQRVDEVHSLVKDCVRIFLKILKKYVKVFDFLKILSVKFWVENSLKIYKSSKYFKIHFKQILKNFQVWTILKILLFSMKLKCCIYILY
jgi:hypothetical protein